MKHERKFLICLSLLRDFKVKHREKMFSKYLLFVYYLLDTRYFLPLMKHTVKSVQNDHSRDHSKGVVFWTGGVCKTPVGDYFWWFYKEKCFQKFFWVLCFKSSPKEVFYYKGFLQMCSKIVELPRGNISLETHLNCRVMLLKGTLFFRLFWGSQYLSTSKPIWILRKKTKVWKKEIETFANLFI